MNIKSTTEKIDIIEKHTEIETEDGQTLYLVNDRVTDINNVNINDLPINTLFYTKNGGWTGLIEQRDDGKYLSMYNGVSVSPYFVPDMEKKINADTDNRPKLHIIVVSHMELDENNNLVLIDDKKEKETPKEEKENNYDIPGYIEEELEFE